MPTLTAATALGNVHADPYDCLLVGVARADRLTLLTGDAPLLEHAAPVLGDLLLQA